MAQIKYYRFIHKSQYFEPMANSVYAWGQFYKHFKGRVSAQWSLRASFHGSGGLPRACTINYYGFVIYRFRSRLVCFSKIEKVTGNNKITLAYYVICTFPVHYVSVMFYSACSRIIYFATVISYGCKLSKNLVTL